MASFPAPEALPNSSLPWRGQGGPRRKQIPSAAVLLLNHDATALVARAASGLEEEVEQGITIPLAKRIAGRIAAERRPGSFER